MKKSSQFRSEFKSIKSSNGHNYLVMRFRDDKNKNWEYHVYAEVIASEVADEFGISKRKKSRISDLNTRERFDILWNKK